MVKQSIAYKQALRATTRQNGLVETIGSSEEDRGHQPTARNATESVLVRIRGI